MSNELREKAGMVYNIVEAVILAMSVGLLVWLSNVVILQGKDLTRVETKQATINDRVLRIESFGSNALMAHEKQDDTRVSDIKDRLGNVELAVVAIQSIPGELKAIQVSLDSMHEGQKRIEERLDKISK